jgi:predicted kinase
VAATLNVIFGPCAAGKTTYAHALARREGAVAFVLDEWGARLFGPDLQGPIEFAWMLERLGRCNALIWSTAEAVLAAGTASTGFADQSHLSRWVRRAHGVSPTELTA